MNAASNLKPREHSWVVAQGGCSWRLDTLAQASDIEGTRTAQILSSYDIAPEVGLIRRPGSPLPGADLAVSLSRFARRELRSRCFFLLLRYLLRTERPYSELDAATPADSERNFGRFSSLPARGISTRSFYGANVLKVS
jgi:hypothetical protein